MGEGGEPRIKEKERRKRSKKERRKSINPRWYIKEEEEEGSYIRSSSLSGFFSLCRCSTHMREKRAVGFGSYVSRVITPDRSRPHKSATKRFPAKTPMMMKTVVWAYVHSSG